MKTIYEIKTYSLMGYVDKEEAAAALQEMLGVLATVMEIAPSNTAEDVALRAFRATVMVRMREEEA